jgi:hypothetical protein
MTMMSSVRAMMESAAASVALAITGVASPPPEPDPDFRFRAQEIVKDFGVGYAVAAGDVNGDKKTDILAIRGTLQWVQNAPGAARQAAWTPGT